MSNNSASKKLSSSGGGYVSGQNPKTSASTTDRSSSVKSKKTPRAKKEGANTEDKRVEKANKEVDTHSASEVLWGKEDWLFASVPSSLVAGGKAVLYFNKTQSSILRDRPHIQLHAKFNNWELDSGATDRVDMTQVDVQIDGASYLKAELKIPSDAYEMNFIFSDKEELYDNNNMENYVLPIEGSMTHQKWIDTAPERAAEEYRSSVSLMTPWTTSSSLTRAASGHHADPRPHRQPACPGPGR